MKFLASNYFISAAALFGVISLISCGDSDTKPTPTSGVEEKANVALTPLLGTWKEEIFRGANYRVQNSYVFSASGIELHRFISLGYDEATAEEISIVGKSPATINLNGTVGSVTLKEAINVSQKAKTFFNTFSIQTKANQVVNFKLEGDTLKLEGDQLIPREIKGTGEIILTRQK